MENVDTICALATPPGNAGVAVIRLSGPKSFEIAEHVTHAELTARHAHYVSLFTSQGDLLDQGIAIYFPGPNSFTGEDIVEFHPHGNPYVCEAILSTLVEHGARLAKAGEFSERAFINNKMDLAQLEAIADLISSGSEQAAKSAVLSMQGKFSQAVAEVLQQLIRIRVHIEASLDFSDEDIELETRTKMHEQIVHLQNQIEDLLNTAKQGLQLQKGATLVLTGQTNVGKSSLFNVLCSEERAIVTDIHGTTRDIVSADIHINGYPISIMDTAGIREHAEVVEQEGINRAQHAIDNADLILTVLVPEQFEQQHIQARPNEIIILNKIDLLEESLEPSEHVIEISVKTGEGIDVLKSAILEKLNIVQKGETPFSARARHIEALNQAFDLVHKAITLISAEYPLELVAEELRLGQQSLAQITGEFTPDDLLDYVFREFCIGK